MRDPLLASYLVAEIRNTQKLPYGIWPFRFHAGKSLPTTGVTQRRDVLLIRLFQAMAYMYFVVTLTTLEKRFKIPSHTTGREKTLIMSHRMAKFHLFRYRVEWK